jgi:hypothetical protein
LWDARIDQTLTLAGYEALGDDERSGLAVALARRADATLRRFNADQIDIARRILLRLISFGEGRSDTRRQQPRAQLRAAGVERYVQPRQSPPRGTSRHPGERPKPRLNVLAAKSQAELYAFTSSIALPSEERLLTMATRLERNAADIGNVHAGRYTKRFGFHEFDTRHIWRQIQPKGSFILVLRRDACDLCSVRIQKANPLKPGDVLAHLKTNAQWLAAVDDRGMPCDGDSNRVLSALNKNTRGYWPRHIGGHGC